MYTFSDGRPTVAQDKSLVSRPDQPLAGTAITEMTQREQWNKKNPPTEATIVKDLRTTELVAREYREWTWRSA